MSNAADEDKNVDFSTVEEIRLKVNQYFRKLKGIGGPRVMELFKKLNTTLENPNSETKQTVCSYSSQHLMSLLFSCNVFNFRDHFYVSFWIRYLNSLFNLSCKLKNWKIFIILQTKFKAWFQRIQAWAMWTQILFLQWWHQPIPRI